MKNKLLALALLSAISIIGLILVWTNHATRYYTINSFGIETFDHFDYNTGWLIGMILAVPSGIASFVMGIVTLATSKRVTESKGLVTAAGVLGILFGCLGANVIVAGIGFFKVKEQSKEEFESEIIVTKESVETEKLKKEKQDLELLIEKQKLEKELAELKSSKTTEAAPKKVAKATTTKAPAKKKTNTDK